MASVLLLTSYPFVKPRHGGQHRAYNISKKFESCGWNVSSLSVFEEETYQDFKDVDIVFPAVSPYRSYRGQNIPFITDLQTSKFVSEQKIISFALSRIPRNIDVIFVEQPWLWPLAAAYKKLVCHNVLLCYGSQNIEFELKGRILSSMTGDAYKSYAPIILRDIENLERTAASEADIVISVSESESHLLRNWGAKNVVIAPNGVSERSPKPELISNWSKRLGEIRFLAYIASAHPPNFTNFSEIMGGSLGCFPPNTKLFVAGSVCEQIYLQCMIGQFSSVNQSRLELAFEVADEDIDAIKYLAHGFLLPIPFGGGTNLKTAEALLTRKYVIATPDAMRGFERYISSPEIFVSNSPQDLHGVVRQVFDSAPIMEQIAARNELTWSVCLQPIIDALSSKMSSQ